MQININKEYQRVISPPSGSFFLFGPRGTGKSSWLKATFPNAHFVNLLEERLFQSYIFDIGQFENTINTLPNHALVVIHEVQRLPALLNEVHRFIEEKKMRFILSGSSARQLRRQGVNLLAGRALRRDLFPLVPEELGGDFNLEQILTHGSIAVVWSQSSPAEALDVYVQTYLRQEVQNEALVRNLPSFARFLQVAALFHSQVLNISSLSRDAGVQRTTVSSYLDILDDTLMTFRLPAYQANLRAKERVHPKFYWFDPGVVRAIKHQLGPLAQEERGPLFEGFIAQTLRSYKSYRRTFDDWAYWAVQKHEVDFILFKDDRCVAIEVKCSSRFRAEYAQSLDLFAETKRFKGKMRRIVVYTGDTVLRTQTGIEVLPVATFLKELQLGTLFPA